MKPKEGEKTSQPWQWPLTWQVLSLSLSIKNITHSLSQGQLFSGGDYRVYLLGNPVRLISKFL